MFLLINSIITTMHTKAGQFLKLCSPSRQQSLLSTSRKKPKRQFFVEQHRKEIDDYMIGAIKKNKTSLKHIKNEIQHLKAQMQELKKQNLRQEVNHDILANQLKNHKKNKSSARSDASLSNLGRGRSLRQVQLTARRQFLPAKDSSNTSRKDSRISKKTIEAKNFDYCQERDKMNYSTTRTEKTIKKSYSCDKHEKNSKNLLRKKIEQLKTRAHMIKKSAEKIKDNISSKLKKRMEENEQKQEINSPPIYEDNDNNRHYEELMQLLRTEKSIRLLTQGRENQIHAKQLQCLQTGNNKQQPKQTANQEKNNLSIHMEQSPENKETHAEKSMLSTNRDFNHPKSLASANYFPEVREFRGSSSNLPSETNLLQSDKVIRSSQPIPYSAPAPKPQSNDSQFQQLLGECAANRGIGICSGGSELSFEGKANPQVRSLKQLQFQFDQLVRQQLMSSDAMEKQALGKAIRVLIRRIAELRELAEGE